jgi:site-specific recombinase XerC
MNEITIAKTGAVAEFTFGAKVTSAIELWLAGLSSEGTRNAYRWELQQFAAFAGHADVATAMASFLKLTGGQAHAVADAWRAQKIGSGRSPASVNRSMATLNSFVASAKRHGLTDLSLKARSEKAIRYRDTRGCGLGGVQKLLAEAQGQYNAKAARDTAILRLAFGLGLRRNEIATLDICHIDLTADKIHVLGKGNRERITLTLPKNAKDALAAWLQWRGTGAPDAPLFINLAHNSPGNRISGAGVYDVIRYQLGRRANITARPHGLLPSLRRSMHFKVIIEKLVPSRVMPRLKRSVAMTTIAPIMPARLRPWWMGSPPNHPGFSCVCCVRVSLIS